MYQITSRGGELTSGTSQLGSGTSQFTPGEIKEAIVTHLGGDSEEIFYQIMEKIRPLFIGQGEQLLAQAQQALAAGDYDQLWSSAHTLKGMSGSLGLATFSSLSRELEVLAEARAFHAATLQVEELVLAFGQVRQALERLRPA